MFETITAVKIIPEQAIDIFCIDFQHRMDLENPSSFTTETPEYEVTICRIASEYVQIVVPQSLKEKVLGIIHNAKLAGHPGGAKRFKRSRKHFTGNSGIKILCSHSLCSRMSKPG